MVPGYRCRTMQREEIALAVEWAAQEGWNPGLHDADCFGAADPGGFFVGLVEDSPVACISVVKYGSDSGFSLAWRNARYEGRGGVPPPRDPRLVPLAGLPFAAVQAYDRPFFPADRTAFLRSWLAQPDAAALGWVEDGALRGYGVIRRCRSGWKVGPLFADDESIAEHLFGALSGQATAGEPVFLDIAEPNAAARALVARHGMEKVFETARMYTGTPPATPLDRLYGITSFELG